MFDEIKEEMTRKICELRIWLSNINDSDDFLRLTRDCFMCIYMVFMRKQLELSFRKR